MSLGSEDKKIQTCSISCCWSDVEKDGTNFYIYNLEERGQLGFVFTCKDIKIGLM